MQEASPVFTVDYTRHYKATGRRLAVPFALGAEPDNYDSPPW